MELANYAPQEVIQQMKKFTRLCFENRIIDKILRTSMITQHTHVRLRGFKPSILYSTYTTIATNNDIEIKYSVRSEDTQCALMEPFLSRLYTISHEEKSYRQGQEAVWSHWEDTYTKTGTALPIYKTYYKDIVGNNYVHIIAYACINRAAYAVTDLATVNNIFKSIHFTENPNFLVENDIFETPLMVLSYSHEFNELIETLLLRIDVKSRFKALPIQYWSDKWVKLIRHTFIDNIHTVVKLCDTIKAFLTFYVTLVHGLPQVFTRLFSTGYRFNPNHILFKNEQLNKILQKKILEYPSWHNITSFIAYLDNFDFEQIKALLEKRAEIIKHALLFVSFPEIMSESL